MRACILLVTALTFAPNVAAGPNVVLAVSTLQQHRAAGKGVMLQLIDGAGRGLLAANVYLKSRNLPQMYCLPDDLALLPRNYADIAITWYELDPKGYQGFEDFPADALVYMLLRGLVATYPCK